MNRARDLRAEDFLPAADTNDVAVDFQRPAQGYWQDAWRRLRANRQALASLWIVLLLLAFTLVGPLLWRVDPAQQDLSQISRGPGLGTRALLVESAPHQGEATRFSEGPTFGSTDRFTVRGEATTEGVQLQWQPVPGASGYRVYRHILKPSGALDLGLPLAELEGNQTRFRDSLRLNTHRYYYTLLPLADSEQPMSNWQTLAITPRPAISIQRARSLGLYREGMQVGEIIQLPAHPLGTDYLGRDMLARLMYGARTSLFIGIGAPLVFVLIGVVYGGLAGFVGGIVDRELMRVADFVMALPFLLFMILFKILFGIGPGESGILPMLIALVLLMWPSTARLVRGQVMQARNLAYIEAAQIMGAQPTYIIFRHMLPNLLSVVLVSLTFAVPTAIFTEAFLSFIGMGVVPPTPSWGSMCNDGIRNMLSHPHELILPALLISVTVLAFNLLGDGLRDCLDVRMRGSL